MRINVSELSNEQYIDVLNRLHKKVLEIAIEIKRICEENGIKYFLIGGSLLGVTRHNGFIPWDDDMDIGLLRDDYERFIQICKTSLDDKFELVTTDVSNYGVPFSKIQIRGTEYQEEGAPVYSCGNGIFVDVFPVDKYPDGKLQRKTHGIAVALLRYALQRKCDYPDLGRFVFLKKVTIDFYVKMHTKEYLVKKMTAVASKYNSCTTSYLYTTGSSYKYGREIMEHECFEGPLPEFSFEGIEFKCPNKREIILKRMYGNYMELPSIEKRYNRHGVIYLDFGE